MNAKTTIRKLLFVSLWLLIGAGMLSLLIAAIGKKHRDQCKDYEVSFRGNPNLFVDAKDVSKLLMTATGGSIKGQPIASFKLHQLEQTLEENTWIKDAELYFNNRDILKVIITERQPVARIFTNGTSSFYLDSLGKRLPLTNRVTMRVPVFTGFPEKKQWTAKDSALARDVRNLAGFIGRDSFWTAQVAQVDITPDRRFEIVPVVGNHLIRLGNAENLDQKFHRLMIFYQQVLSKTGFDRYRVVDVQYEGQVVASKFSGMKRVDSVQLKMNVEKLLRQALDTQADTEDVQPEALPSADKKPIKQPKAVMPPRKKN